MSSPATRCFEFIGGTSCKFWEVSIRGSEVHVCFGRIGGAGQTQTKTFAAEEQARQHADKLIRAKTAKGYREVGTPRAA